MDGMDIFRLNVVAHGVMMSLKHAMREMTYAMNQWYESIFLQLNNAQAIQQFLHLVHQLIH